MKDVEGTFDITNSLKAVFKNSNLLVLCYDNNNTWIGNINFNNDFICDKFFSAQSQKTKMHSNKNN